MTRRTMDLHAAYADACLTVDLVGRVPQARPEVRAQLLAIGYQESRWIWRTQIGGPARGFYMFEPIAVRDLMQAAPTRDTLRELADYCGVPYTSRDLFRALETHDLLATGMARLFLSRLPARAPARREGPEASWVQYLAQWRPGRPHPQTWDAAWTFGWRIVEEAMTSDA